MNRKRSIRAFAVLLSLSFMCAASSLVCKKAAMEDTPGMIAQPESSALWVIEKQGLRMRDSPDQAGNVLGMVPYGTKVKWFSKQGETMTISGASGKWAHVEWDGKKGWVFDGFLGYSDPNAPKPGDPQLIDTATRYFANKVRNDKSMAPDISAEILKYGVRVLQAYGNLAVVKRMRVDRVSATDTGFTSDLWAKTAGGWKTVIEDDMSGWGNSITLRYLNRDDLIDAVVSAGGEAEQFSFYLGKSAESFENIGYVNLMMEGSDKIKWGRCENLSISGREPDGRQVTVSMDCSTNTLKKTYK